MIRVFYTYYPMHGETPIETYNDFYDWIKALRFIKKVDGKSFNGFVTGWECDDPYDNEMLYRRHVLHHPSI